MKLFLPLLLLSFAVIMVNGQTIFSHTIYKYEVERKKEISSANGKTSKDWYKTDIIIVSETVNWRQNAFTVKEKDITYKYIVIDSSSKKKNANGEDFFDYTCMASNSGPCEVRMCFLKNDTVMLTVKNSEKTIFYEMDVVS